jgi:hypothetical protein
MKWRRPLLVPLIGMRRDRPTPPIPNDMSVTGQALLKLSYIQAHSPYQREVLGAYSRAVIELARCHHELEKMGEPDAAATLARYASEVTDTACEHVAMSAEIHPEPQ